MRGFEELAVIGRLSVDELVDYFKRVKGKERGLVKIAFDAVNRGYNVMDEIVRRSDIPGDLANAFKRVYGERLKKMEETARKYIDKYRLPSVEEDVSSIRNFNTFINTDNTSSKGGSNGYAYANSTSIANFSRISICHPHSVIHNPITAHILCKRKEEKRQKLQKSHYLP